MEDHNESDESGDDYLETSSISSSDGSEASFSCFDNEHDFDILWSPTQDSEADGEMSKHNLIQFEDKDDVALMTLNASHLVTLEGDESVVKELKEQKRMVLEKMLNKEFKAHVAQLLKFFDIRKIELGEGERWIDIVTNLAWEAASFVRPDVFEEKVKNLAHFVKITCVASGSPSQSHVVRGLIFKKHAMHKHMQTEFNHPRLLLARGFLGQSSSGFISFDMILSPISRKNQVMSVAKYLKECGANVVLVERGASRDLVDVLLAHGLNISIVSNMKLHRLERIARCTTSTIISLDQGGSGGGGSSYTLSLRSCNRLVFRNIVEEHSFHNMIMDGRRRPHKTLMFIEGCPTRLGCTVLLKGSHSDELKKIKRVVRAAVFTAYHLIRVTSFRMDLNAMFSATAGVNVSERSQPSQTPSTSLDEKLVASNVPSRVGSSNGKTALTMTSLNFSRGLVCDHGGCSITNFTLAKYILDYLFNQSWRCKTCKEGCEAHIHYYAHNNSHLKQQLGVRIQHLQAGEYLPYSEDKDERVWFWRRCAKCKQELPTKRSLLSEEALGLPFRRFLDLYFSNPSPFDFPSLHCAHSPHSHFLLFIGSGSMVAVFKYSAMVTKSEVLDVEDT